MVVRKYSPVAFAQPSVRGSALWHFALKVRRESAGHYQCSLIHSRSATFYETFSHQLVTLFPTLTASRLQRVDRLCISAKATISLNLQ